VTKPSIEKARIARKMIHICLRAEGWNRAASVANKEMPKLTNKAVSKTLRIERSKSSIRLIRCNGPDKGWA
jgi:hypothetical protein